MRRALGYTAPVADEERKPFKESLDRRAIKSLASAVTDAWPGFDERAFVRTATRGLRDLELKDRVRLVIAALHRHLPDDFEQALAIVVRAGEAWDRAPNKPEGFAFGVWPLIDFVGEHGVEHFDASMDALHDLTHLFSAEFAVRPFIRADTRKAMAKMRKWTRDRDEHVRRLASEGCRPRLPWGGQLAMFMRDPEPVIAVLERLKDDPAEYVRRSVSNNLNDIAKDHPERVVEVCAAWAGASKERDWIVGRALRTLVKQGHPGALKVLGYDSNARVAVEGFRLGKKRVKVGDELELRFTIRSKARRRQPLVIDYAVHHVKKNGARTPKVFKLKQVELAAGESMEIRKVHKLRKVTTRVYHSGRHAIDILVNGKVRASAEFDLKA